MTTPTDRDTQPAEAGLFEDLPGPSQAQVQQAQAKAASKQRRGAPRLLEPNRLQVELRASDLESLLSEDHRARLVWGYVVHQDLSKLFEAVKARGSNAGRAAIDPRILFALWLYATLDGVGSGREVARLSLEHDAYRWICGGVSVNYHALNDFRAGNEVLMDELLTDNVAEVAAAKKRNGGKAEDARASTTDADARVMKMGDGGFRPAFNVQFATECEGQVIVGMDVVNAGKRVTEDCCECLCAAWPRSARWWACSCWRTT